jgi:cytidine deaminase
MLSESDQLLVRAAREAAERAYAPYSMCFTGAAVRSIRELIYVGASLESASYGLTLCAEMNALAAANQAGEYQFLEAIAVVGPKLSLPCGRCRQLILECAQISERDIDVISCSLDLEQITKAKISSLLPQ